MNNGTNVTWIEARNTCLNEINLMGSNWTVLNASTHLIALEHPTERSALLYWMKGM